LRVSHDFASTIASRSAPMSNCCNVSQVLR
jgi:hypothetical protein